MKAKTLTFSDPAQAGKNNPYDEVSKGCKQNEEFVAALHSPNMKHWMMLHLMPTS
jgi:hypothetical protein